MNDNVVNKKSFLSQVTEIVKTNIRNIIILLSLCFVLFLSFQIYSFYISNKIQKNSISFFAAQNIDDTNVITDTITKLSNDNTFYGVLAKLELIDLTLKQNNIEDSISMYLEVINQNNLETVYKSAIASKASYQLIDINFENLSLNYLNIINDFISYIDDETDSYKGIKLELRYLIKILEAEKNSIDYSSFNKINDIYENMKLFSKNYDFTFPYLFDESQEVAKQYGAVCTPDIFGFNYKNLLCYRGRIDSGVMNSDHKKIDRELYNAMVKIKNDGIGPDKQLNSFGCSIKWK